MTFTRVFFVLHMLVKLVIWCERYHHHTSTVDTTVETMTRSSPCASVSPLNRNLFCEESDLSGDLDAGRAGADLNSVVHQFERGPSTNTLNSSSMSTGYHSEGLKCRVHRRPHRVYPKAFRAQENVVPLVSRAGCSGSPPTGAPIPDGVENGILGTDRKITIQPHAFHPYVATPIAYMSCRKEAANGGRMDEAQPKNDGLSLEKKRSRRHSEPAREVLVEWFGRKYVRPYPSKEEKLDLAKRTGLTIEQVNIWFANQRSRHWEGRQGRQKKQRRS